MRNDRGSVLFLYPVGFLIVLMLGAIAVDLGNVWLQQRRLADAADSAANDAVTYGVDQNILRSTGELELSNARIDEIVAVSVAGQNLPPEAVVTDASGIVLAGVPAVTVTIESEADLIFGRFVRSGGIGISATGVAELIDGG
ncbi:MAG: pilus assembly protein TadG-related protein [Actinomycetota bacterium]